MKKADVPCTRQEGIDPARGFITVHKAHIRGDPSKGFIDQHLKGGVAGTGIAKPSLNNNQNDTLLTGTRFFRYPECAGNSSSPKRFRKLR